MTTFQSGPPNAFPLGDAARPAPQLPKMNFERAVQDGFAAIPEVRSLEIERNQGEILVWIGVDRPLQSLRHEIYNKQAVLIEAFPEVLFDFRLVAAE